jgi:hypothetical protein
MKKFNVTHHYEVFAFDKEGAESEAAHGIAELTKVDVWDAETGYITLFSNGDSTFRMPAPDAACCLSQALGVLIGMQSEGGEIPRGALDSCLMLLQKSMMDAIEKKGASE